MTTRDCCRSEPTLSGTPGLAKARASGTAICAGCGAGLMLFDTAGVATDAAIGVAEGADCPTGLVLCDTAGMATNAATGVADGADCPAGLTMSDTAGFAVDIDTGVAGVTWGDSEALSEGVIGALAVCKWRWAEPRLGESVCLAAGVNGRVTGAFRCCAGKGKVVLKYPDNSFVADNVVP